MGETAASFPASKDMTLTGEDGIVCLAHCEATGIALVNCDPYIREWIRRQGRESWRRLAGQSEGGAHPHS